MDTDKKKESTIKKRKEKKRWGTPLHGKECPSFRFLFSDRKRGERSLK